MDNNRETKEIVTPSGQQKVIIKAWLTGGEKREITSAMLGETTFNSQDTQNFQMKGEMITKAQDVALEQVIVSIDDNKEDILKRVLEMRSEDFDAIVAEINKITSGEKEEDVKKK